MNTATRRVTRCRYLDLGGPGAGGALQCTAEALDETAQILLCEKHMGRALAFLNAALVITNTTKEN